MAQRKRISRGGKCPAVGTWWTDAEDDLLTIVAPGTYSWHDSTTELSWQLAADGGAELSWPLREADAPDEPLDGLTVVPVAVETATTTIPVQQQEDGSFVSDPIPAAKIVAATVRDTPVDEGAAFTPRDGIRLAIALVREHNAAGADDVIAHLEAAMRREEVASLPLEQAAWMSYTGSDPEAWARVPVAVRAAWVELVTTVLSHPDAESYL
jgi:hypothetical protein